MDPKAIVRQIVYKSRKKWMETLAMIRQEFGEKA
jgi:hypothetical protein